jgi:hypothetical protein
MLASLLTLLAFLLTPSAAPAAEPSPVIAMCRVGDTLMVYDPRPEFGIGAHGLDDPKIALIKDLGIRLVRFTMYWAAVEPTTTPRQYDPAQLAAWDDVVARTGAAGISLEVVVHAPPPGCAFANRAESYQRFAGFMQDMATRYPSIRYWELFNEMDAGFTDLFGARNDVPMRERGRMYAEMLKVVYPRVKAANPLAVVLTGGMSDTDEFPRGIYEGGGRDFFDIMNVHTYGVPVVWAFVDRGMRVREIMEASGDAHKPLWNTEFGIDAGNLIGAWGYPHDRGEDDATTLDRLMAEQWQQCLDAAEHYGLYQKLFAYQLHAGNERNDDGQVSQRLRLPEGQTLDDYGFGILRRDGMTPRPVYDWLKQRDFNRDIRLRPTASGPVEFWAWDGRLPAGCEANRWRPGYLRLEDVPVDSLYPTLIPLLSQE